MKCGKFEIIKSASGVKINTIGDISGVDILLGAGSVLLYIFNYNKDKSALSADMSLEEFADYCGKTLKKSILISDNRLGGEE